MQRSAAGLHQFTSDCEASAAEKGRERESEVEATIGVKAEDGVLKKTLNGKKWYIKTRSQTVLLGDDDDNNNIGNLGQLKRKRGQSGREGKREREVTCFGSISISTLPVVMLARLLLLH